MDYEVLKPFNSVNRRFAPGPGPGGSISFADDISPFTIEDRLTSGFIKLRPVPIPADLPAPVSSEPSANTKPKSRDADDK
jgi:hypothetical protein